VAISSLENGDDVDLKTKLAEERATCRLHEALCHLKDKNYIQSIKSCTDVLMDGVHVVELDDDDDEEDDSTQNTGDEDEMSVMTILTKEREILMILK